MKDLLTSGQILARKAKTQGKSIFYAAGDQSVTYREVDDRSNSVANSLTGLSVKKGDKVCLLLGNTVEHIYASFATAKIGAVLVPANTSLTGDQLAHIINNSDAELLLTEADLLPQVEAIRDRLAKLKTIVVSKGEKSGGTMGKWRLLPYSELLKGSCNPPEVEVNGSDLACMLYTSGTTGLPKGVMLSHEYFSAGAEILVSRYKETKKDVFFATLPLYHIMGIMQGISSPLQVGAKVALMERFSVSGYWRDIRRYKATTSCLTGAQCVLIHQAPPRPDDGQHTVRLIMSFPAPANIVEDFEKRFKLRLRTIYGLTEALLPIAAYYDPKKNKHGSLGKATDYDVRIADDADHALPNGKVGNIILRPKSISRRVFDGYYGKPEATMEMIEHCWFHTGDTGYKDEDGFFWYSGRKKDVIRFRGENVSATHLESVISAHPAIKECTVIGVPSAISEEDVKVLAVLKESVSLRPEQLISFCEDRLVWFMVPRYVEFVIDLPKSATDKVQKAKLKDNWKTSATWDREAAGYQLRKKSTK